MGYCVHQEKCEFHLPNEFKWAALASLKAQFPGDRHITSCTTLVGAMAEWRYDITTDIATGDIFGIEFRGEKSGDEEYLFGAIAPFVVPDSYIQFRGEDGAIWRWIFDGQNAHEVNAVVTFPLPP